jgi:porin
LLGLGIASARFSDHFRAANAEVANEITPSETAIEIFYKAIIGKSLSLQPDIQYIANPGGQYKDALLPGLRFEAIF